MLFRSPASQRSGRGDLPSPLCRLRTGPSAQSTALVTNDPLLASAGGGLDQPTVIRNRTRTSYLDDGCLNGRRGVIFPGSHRSRLPDLPTRPLLGLWSSSSEGNQEADRFCVRETLRIFKLLGYEPLIPSSETLITDQSSGRDRNPDFTFRGTAQMRHKEIQ